MKLKLKKNKNSRIEFMQPLCYVKKLKIGKQSKILIKMSNYNLNKSFQ